MLSSLLFISSIGLLQLTSPSDPQENLRVGGYYSRLGESGGYMEPPAGADKYLRLRTSTDDSGMSTPVDSSEEAENLTDVCGKREWVIDYFILRDGFAHLSEINEKLDWLCSGVSDGLPASLEMTRFMIIQVLNTLEESVDDVVYSLRGASDILDNESSLHALKGGDITRHDALETIKLAIEILMHTSSDIREPEIALRDKVAIYLAVHADEFGSKYQWVSKHCAKDHLPVHLFPTRRPGADYGSNINFLSVLEALKNVAPGTDTTIKGSIEQIVRYVNDPLEIKDIPTFLDYLEPLIESVDDFIDGSKSFKELCDALTEDVEMMVKYQGYFRKGSD
jgi:hypothetical protein